MLLLLLLAANFSASASPSDPANQEATRTQVREIFSFGKRFNWPLEDIAFVQKTSGGDSLASKQSWGSTIERYAQLTGLPGDTENYNLVYGQKTLYVSEYELPYTLEFRFWFGKASGRMLSAYIAIIPYGDGGYDEDRAFLRNINESESNIVRDMKSYYQRNILKANDEISSKDFPLAYKITNLSANKAFQTLFSQYGFYADNLSFGYTIPRPSNPKDPESKGQNHFSTRDLEKALFVATNGKGKTLSIDSSSFFFAEQSYVVPNSKNKFYIDFCAANEKGPIMTYSQISSFKSGKKVYPDYCFLIVRPAKPKSGGALDRFFYPADTSLKTISADMQLYFSGKSLGSNTYSNNIYLLK